ncbi:BrxE family protein [Halomicrobium salinisoli]|uniref:BrxE family protein n=1 Tax=Halomicrobium salinisoli TaxID=2878391 RepID=UPI001CF0A7ED|nr:BrxE family protein [Halomicrobium salinisoli]
MTSADVADVFASTRETLEKAGMADDFFLDLVASRLVVERVGESSNQDWWESRVLSETGRSRLSEVTPKTRLKSRITLALKVGRKAESDRVADDSISLFSLGPQIESRITAAIEELESNDDLTFEALEDLSVQSLEKGWTDAIITATASNISSTDITEPQQSPESGESYLIGEKGYTQDEIEPDKWRIFTTLLRGYGQCTDQLQVPYYTLESELKSENA